MTGKLKSGARIWISKLLVIGLFGWILGFGVLAWMRATSEPPELKTLRSPFAPLDGAWEGDYVIMDTTGRVVHSSRVRREFRHVLPGFKLRDRGEIEFRQEGHFDVTNADTGETTLERVLSVHNAGDGRYTRKVIRHNGRDSFELRGRVEGDWIIWSRETPDLVESFRERVAGDEYIVDGTGTYDDSGTSATLTFRGRFTRVGPEIASDEQTGD